MKQTGVFKLVADVETLKVLGVHIVSENAGDVIYAASLAVKFEFNDRRFNRNPSTIFNNG